MISDSTNVSGLSNLTQFRIPECRLSEDLGGLLENKSFADVILATPNREFKAHKSVLACK